ncbi:hypothetical protein BKI52_02725 [marine bacterium AO1-C]|nr:hypothetical protein BKI52_02725 [marine bacterium AO1-C]
MESPSYPLNEEIIERPIGPLAIPINKEEEKPEVLPPEPTFSDDTNQGQLVEEEPSSQKVVVPHPAINEEKHSEDKTNHQEKKPGSEKINDLFSSTLVNLLLNLLPELMHSISRMDETKVFILERSGKLEPGTYDLIKQMNLENKEEFQDKANTHREEIITPLQEIFRQRGARVGPEFSLATAVTGLLVSSTMMTMKARKKNKSILEQIIELNANVYQSSKEPESKPKSNSDTNPKKEE